MEVSSLCPMNSLPGRQGFFYPHGLSGFYWVPPKRVGHDGPQKAKWSSGKVRCRMCRTERRTEAEGQEVTGGQGMKMGGRGVNERETFHRKPGKT